MRKVETADAGPAKTTAAVHSLVAWYRFEQDRLQRERSLFRENLAGAELDRVLQENVVEQRALDAGWENSSLRRKIEERAEQPLAVNGVERRVGLVAPGAPHLVTGVRAAGTAATTTAKQLIGYAAVFDKPAELGGFREFIAPGAFAGAIKTSDVRCLFNHDANYIYGRSSASTLELEEDRIGLRFACYLLSFDAASYALARRIDRRDISGCSFSFIVAKDTWRFARRPGDIDERTILEIARLYDVGPVTYPAYSQTSVQAIFEKLPARSESPAAERVYRPAGSAERLQDNMEFEEALWRQDDYKERMDCEDDEQWDRDFRLRSLLTRLHLPLLSPARQREVERMYRKAGRIILRCQHD
jgi:HK97 family phage prohead protease